MFIDRNVIILGLVFLSHIYSHLLTNFRFSSLLIPRNLTTPANPLETKLLIVQKENKNEVKSRSIQSDELVNALQNSLHMISLTTEEIKQKGWRLVQQTDCFSLYKRHSEPLNDGPYEYMMIGMFKDVSPKNFLLYQTHKSLRQMWDDTMKTMTVLSQEICKPTSYPCSDIESQDMIYYRAKWPWPLKDRDYTLSRRVAVFPDSSAIVFVSRAVELPQCPAVQDVMRVDNYRCHSAFICSSSSSPSYYSPSSSPPLQLNTLTSSIYSSLASILSPCLSSLSTTHFTATLHGPSASLLSNNKITSNMNINENGFKNKPNNIKRVTLLKHFGSGPKLNRNPFESLSSQISEKLSEMKANIDNFAQAHSGRSKSSGSTPSSHFDLPGVKFVTIFCDDQKVPLPKVVIDAISSQAERMAAQSIHRLHLTAKQSIDQIHNI